MKPPDQRPEVWVVSNRNYWKAIWRDAEGVQHGRSIGAKAKYSRRQARVLARGIALSAARKPVSGVPRLSEWLERYRAMRTDVGESTRRTYGECGVYLLEYFDNDPPINAVTRAAAADWRDTLASGELTASMNARLKTRGEKNPAGRSWRRPQPATVARHVRAAKLMFGEAVDRDMLEFNPFDKLSGTPPAVVKDWRQVTAEDMDRILEACPSSGWRALFGLCRFAGLRLGEALTLRWQDIDWAGNRMRVNETITKETTKKRRRVAPLEVAKCHTGLTAILRQALEAAPPGTMLVCSVSSNNVRRGARAILRRCGVGEYPKPFHTLRKCCESEWSRYFPQYAVCDWLGNSLEVASAHYLRVPEELFAPPSSTQDGYKSLPDNRQTTARQSPDSAGKAGNPRT